MRVLNTLPARALAALMLFLTLALPGLAPAAGNAADAEFLDPEQAFVGSAQLIAPRTLAIEFKVAPGYHLYRERFALLSPAGGLPVASLPSGQQVYDANFKKNMTLWAGTLRIEQPLGDGALPKSLAVHYQGCADRGLCYPPQQAVVHLEQDAQGQPVARWESLPDALAAPEASDSKPAAALASAAAANATQAQTSDASEGGTAALQSGSLLRVAGMFLLGGLLLSLTPCVLPMLPILSSIIVGQGAPVSRLRGFTLALAYSLGMALVYTVAGIVAGLLGSGFAAALQNPWVLGSFALLLSALALSMFGVWEFQMPGFIQDRVNNASNRISGGKHVGVFLMGGLSALLVGPCVAAPLAGALVYISQTRDVLLGGLALFALACGMSVPLLLLGLSAGTLLPRAGGWMEHVKSFFGLLLLAVALWLVSPVLPTAALMVLIGAVVLVAAVCFGAFEAGRPRALRAAGTLALLWGVAQLGGGLSGGDSVLQPLRHLARGGASLALPAAQAAGTAPAFERITSVDELDAALAQADRPLVLDFYADWCVACKEMEHLTFSDPAIAARLKQARLLQADVTANSPQAKALLKRFQLFGPPGILFFDRQGQEVASARTIGFLDAEAFARKLDRAAL